MARATGLAFGCSLLLVGWLAACDGGEVGGGDPGTSPGAATDGGLPVNNPATGGPEVCDGYDNNGDGQVDEGCACTTGQTAECFPGPVGQAGVGICKKGTHTCQGDAEFGSWGQCTGAVGPKPEICGNGIDEDCDGKDALCPGTVAVTLNIDGDCVTASCPPNAPFPVGCNVSFQGGDSRGCVAVAPGSSVVYFQEGDKCKAGHLSGTLYCSSNQGAPLGAVNCPINKSDKYYPTGKSGCPKIDD